MSQRPTIVTMKWGTLFGPDYVNVLFRACRAASKMAFDFVCFTENAEGLDPEIIVKPLPQIGLAPEEWYQRGVWPKLALYKAELEGLRGRCLFIDLDMMVLSDLDAFLTNDAPFITTDMGKSWYPGMARSNPEPGTCIFAFNFGEQTAILDAFLADKAGAKQKFQNEQDFAGAHASSMDFWPEGWVISFKRWLRRPIGLDLILPPKRPPESAKILAFHGDPRPIDLMQPGLNFWDNFPHMGHGQVDWVVDYWTRNGGKIG